MSRRPVRPARRKAYSPRARALARERNRGVLLLLLTLAIVGAIAAVWFYTADRRIKLADNLCPVGQAPPALAVVLLDQTDQLSALQKIDLHNKFGALVKQLPVHARIEVFSFRNAAGELTGPLVDVCNPGTAESWEAIYLNPELVKRRFQTEYVERIDKAVDALVDFKDAPQSPIMEAVQALAVSVFDRPNNASIADRRLFLASDLIQNTTRINMFAGGPPDFLLFKQDPSYLRIRSNLRDVRVTLWQFRNDRAIALQGEKLVRFWLGYFNDLGASIDARLWVPN